MKMFKACNFGMLFLTTTILAGSFPLAIAAGQERSVTIDIRKTSEPIS